MADKTMSTSEAQAYCAARWAVEAARASEASDHASQLCYLTQRAAQDWKAASAHASRAATEGRFACIRAQTAEAELRGMRRT
jgi:hypothetical protein